MIVLFCETAVVCDYIYVCTDLNEKFIFYCSLWSEKFKSLCSKGLGY